MWEGSNEKQVVRHRWSYTPGPLILFPLSWYSLQRLTVHPGEELVCSAVTSRCREFTTLCVQSSTFSLQVQHPWALSVCPHLCFGGPRCSRWSRQTSVSLQNNVKELKEFYEKKHRPEWKRLSTLAPADPAAPGGPCTPCGRQQEEAASIMWPGKESPPTRSGGAH